jgi:hypothetical protein
VHKKQPAYIWGTIILLSAISTVLLYIGRSYFDYKEEPKEVSEAGAESNLNAS